MIRTKGEACISGSEQALSDGLKLTTRHILLNVSMARRDDRRRGTCTAAECLGRWTARTRCVR
jgi:hypothetical protein